MWGTNIDALIDDLHTNFERWYPALRNRQEENYLHSTHPQEIDALQIPIYARLNVKMTLSSDVHTVRVHCRSNRRCAVHKYATHDD
jgi:hypothetical protein